MSAVRKLFRRPETPWLAGAVLACALIAGALFVPLWKMELVAPQYPKGLVMYAYGYKFEGSGKSTYDDVREINGLNHYIGMKKITTVTEMKMFVPGVLALIAATLAVSFVAWKRRWLQALIVIGFWAMPLFFVADLQYWLYNYGHTMDPEAPLNTGSFTPKVFGTTKVWNFHSETGFELGFYLMVAAAFVITVVPLGAQLYRASRMRSAAPRAAPRRLAPRPGQPLVLKALLAAAAIAGAIALPAAPASGQAAGSGQLTLQQRIDAAAPEDIIVIDGGVFRESITINKPISLIGHNWPVIDGGGQGDVVTISAGDAVISGFVIRNSGKEMSLEPAAVRIDDANHVTVRGNRLQDARFGVHVTSSRDSIIEDNLVDTGGATPIERRGHGIYLWEVKSSTVHANTVRNAADGIHLEYSDDNGIGGNDVHHSRYALHLMYAHQNKIIDNDFHDNLAGAVVMLSHDVIIKGNNFSGNRKGATGAGVLLKDDDNLFVEDNRLLRNKYGMTVDGAPQAIGATAIFRHNLFALNDVGIAAMSNSPITFVENAMIDNTVQVKAMGGALANTVLSGHGGAAPAGNSAAAPADAGAALPRGAVWSSNGRGNYWSDYRGYDATGDGVGDQPYLPRPPFAGRLGNDDTLRLFQFTPAQQAIDLAADMFPVYRYNAVIADDHPLMAPPSGLGLAHGAGINVRLLACSLLLAVLAAAGFVAGAGADVPRALRRALTARRRGRAPGGAAA